MSFEELKKKLDEFAEHPPDNVHAAKAKAELIMQLIGSLHFRTGRIIETIGNEDDANHIISDYISVIAQAVNKVGDLLTKPRRE